MQKLQLYLGSDRIDLFGDESVSVTQTIQNVRDIAKVFTNFSQTFSVPASPKNNILFKSYYNFNIVGGFDALNKVAGKIELNSLEFKSGFIRLEGVDMRKDKAYAYRITFFGDTVNLKDLIGDDQLSALGSLSLLNVVYSAGKVQELLEVASGDLITPLITHTKRLFYSTSQNVAESGNLNFSNATGAELHGVLFSELKYALRIDKIIRAIEAQYGITFNPTSFFKQSNARYYNLYMWLHRKSGAVVPVSQTIEYLSEVNEFEPNTTFFRFASITNTTLRILQVPTSFGNLSIQPVNQTAKYKVIVYRNGGIFFESIFDSGNRIFTKVDWGQDLPLGNYTVTIVTTSATPLVFLDGNIGWYLEFADLTNPQLTTNADFGTTTSVEFNIPQQIPEQKIIDFLNGLFNLFNLTAYTLPNGNIEVQTIDDYYAAGTTYDITSYLEISKSKVDVALPYKQVNFQYEGLGTFLAKQYEQLNNVGWGSLRFTLDEAIYSAPTEIYTVKPPFEHMQFERLFDQATGVTSIQYGHFTNENEQPYFGKPLLFYPIRILNGTAISFRNTETTHVTVNDYNIPSNSVAILPATSKDNINFGAEINEYTLTSEFSDGSLFNKEYTSYVSAVFNPKRRITKAKAFLPLRIVIALELNDKIIMRNETYIINSVTTNLQSGESNFELLNIV